MTTPKKLGLTTAGYWKIENGKTKLDIDRLFQISEILDISLSELFEISHDAFQHSNNKSETNNQQTIQENKEVYEKLLQSKDEQIALLKSMVKM